MTKKLEAERKDFKLFSVILSMLLVDQADVSSARFFLLPMPVRLPSDEPNLMRACAPVRARMSVYLRA